MVERRHQQRMLWEGWFPEEAAGWWEPWMKHADQVLDDAELLDAVYEAQGQRRPNSRRRGRKQTPSDATLRLAVLKQVRNWSFAETALVKKVVFVTEVLPILWRGMQPFNRGERFPSAASLSTGLRFFLFLPVSYFFASPRFYRKISRQDRLRATSPDSADP